MLFTRSSEEKSHPFEGSFIVLIFEKMSRKRQAAKNQTQVEKLARQQALLTKYERRFEEEFVFHRDSKMRRFCNYFVTLFNQSKISPFTQFVN
jgi:hypothetical protein